jgi:hypothetical protein
MSFFVIMFDLHTLMTDSMYRMRHVSLRKMLTSSREEYFLLY